MIILGIDPGLRITGFGVIRKTGGKLSYIASGTIRTETESSLPERLKVLFQGIAEVVETYRPDCAAIEKVFVNVNPQSTLLLGQARGAAITALTVGGLPVQEYTALQLKQAVVGYGRANKAQVQEMVTRLLDLASTPSPDAADALGMAICHAHSGSGLQTLGEIAPGLAKRGLRVRRGRLIG
ncbi:MAG: crossover junction endodeoxyribonuclease RuvC [Candidatus Protistobacter heckmanni]|nr:crossover junction endodeoxyribonuclease RuvC [Candidatus Protistobacter heckmanni]